MPTQKYPILIALLSFLILVGLVYPQTSTSPLILGTPSSITATATSIAGAVESWTMPTAIPQPNATIRSIICNSTNGLVSGSTFPIGTTTITCLATDSQEEFNTTQFKVTILPSKNQIVPILFSSNPMKIGETTTVSASISGLIFSDTNTTYSWNYNGLCPNFINPADVSSFSYAPTNVTSNCTFTISVSDLIGNTGMGNSTMLLVNQSNTKVSCPEFFNSQSTTCIANVTGYNPTDKIIFNTTSQTGSFNSSTCILSLKMCNITYTDTLAGSYTIKATYLGDLNNAKSSNTTTVIVDFSPTAVWGYQGVLPTVPTITTITNSSCYLISNFSQTSNATISINGINEKIIENSIAPTSASVTINNVSETLNLNAPTEFNTTPPLSVGLRNISWAPALHIITIGICPYQAPLATTTAITTIATTASSTILTTSILSTTVLAISALSSTSAPTT